MTAGLFTGWNSIHRRDHMNGNNNREEAVFLVDNKDFLHLKETEDGYD